MVDVPLAHALMADAGINRYIPSDLSEPVAEVLKVLKAL